MREESTGKYAKAFSVEKVFLLIMNNQEWTTEMLDLKNADIRENTIILRH